MPDLLSTNSIFFFNSSETYQPPFGLKKLYCSVQKALLLPQITVHCPATQINGILNSQHEKGGTTADRKHVFVPNHGPVSGSSRNIHQPLARIELKTAHYLIQSQTRQSVRYNHISFNWKIKALLCLKLKAHLLNPRNNGTLTLLAILGSCNATAGC